MAATSPELIPSYWGGRSAYASIETTPDLWAHQPVNDGSCDYHANCAFDCSIIQNLYRVPHAVCEEDDYRQLPRPECAMGGTPSVSSFDGPDWLDLQLTWRGHDFLDSIRDQSVWAQTKDGARKMGGASWDVLIEIAKAIAKAEAKKRLGIEF